MHTKIRIQNAHKMHKKCAKNAHIMHTKNTTNQHKMPKMFSQNAN